MQLSEEEREVLLDALADYRPQFGPDARNPTWRHNRAVAEARARRCAQELHDRLRVEL
jgi:hypothetical protein